MHSHRDGQARFRAALATQGVPPGVTAVGDLARRFSVYRNTVVHSLTEALGQRFPVVAQLVGPVFFKAMAQVFVAAHPPRSPVLHDYGADFPDFLTGFAPVATLPYLPDVARIEYARGQVYHAADAVPLDGDACQSAVAAAPDDAVLTLDPALRVVVSDHPAVSIWVRNQPGAAAGDLSPGPQAALIFRRADDAIVLPAPPAVAAVVQGLARARTLGRVARDGSDADAADAFVTLLRHRLIVGVTLAPTGGSHD